MGEWSKQLQDETRAVLSLRNVMPFALNQSLGRNGVILKNSDGRFGCLSLQSCKEGHYRITGMETAIAIDKFDSIEDLLSGGWVVD